MCFFFAGFFYDVKAPVDRCHGAHNYKIFIERLKSIVSSHAYLCSINFRSRRMFTKG